jgi:biopolymer transport protein ExbD
MNAAQVKAKSRQKVKRREEQIELEEIEGGEINLIPYLDIVTNLMLFLLVISSSGFVLGQIDTTLPEHASAAAKPPTAPDKEPPLQLIASVTEKNILLLSISGLEGSLLAPKAVIDRVEPPPPATGQPQTTAPIYDYPKFNAALVDIASRRYAGKVRPLESYEIILQADPQIPYETIIDVMDNMRRKLPPPGEKRTAVTDPGVKEDGTPQEPPLPYDVDKHYLFPDILFSSGFD